MPAGWRIQTGLNPDFFISVKQWMKERGNQVAEARKTGNVDAAIKALTEGKQYKAVIKSTLAEDRPYFVYAPDGKCRYILECETKKKWQAYSAE
jgi:hypothetical protein